MFDVNQGFTEALQDFSAGKLSQAEQKCNTILQYYPAFGEAYNLLAAIAQKNKNNDKALQLFRMALQTDRKNSKFIHNIGMVLEMSGKEEEAEAHYKKALQTNPDFLKTYYSLAKLYRKQGKYGEAIPLLQQLLLLQPDNIAAYNLQANLLVLSGKIDEALVVYQKALSLHPDKAELRYNIANIYFTQEKFSEAEQEYRESLTLHSGFILSYLALGHLKSRTGHLSEAKAWYQKVLELQPDHAEALLALASCLLQDGDEHQAKDLMIRSLQSNPQNAVAQYQLANVYLNLGYNTEAKGHLLNAVQLNPKLEEALFALAKLYALENKISNAEQLFQQLLATNTKHKAVYSAEYALFKMKNADWSTYDSMVQQLQTLIADFKVVDQYGIVPPPLTLNYFPIDLPLHYSLSTQYAAQWARRVERFPKGSVERKSSKDGRVRIGYLSPDFRQHAVGLLLSEAFIHHDREKVEVYAYHLVSHEDEYTGRFKAGVDVFRNISALSFEQAFDQIQKDGIDVLIDLGGYTSYTKPSLLAMQPAPVQMQFMGYPDTMGADFISHIIADEWLITPEMETYYKEKVIRIPNAFFTSPIPVAEKRPDRASLGLPETATVFCCFNASYKISPAVFSVWMRLLKEVKNSVLWLSAVPALVEDNLRASAKAAGIGPERLVFAKKLPMEEYMASYACADMFLDTFYYSAGSTAVCALYAGLPVITYAGETNAARMGASISAASGLTETIAKSEIEYFDKALYYAQHPEEIQKLKNRLQKREARLFDLKASIRSLEEEVLRVVKK